MTATWTQGRREAPDAWLSHHSEVLVLLGVAAVVAAVPLAVVAETGSFGGALDRQKAKWTSSAATTSSMSWRNVPGLVLTRCTVNR